MGTNTLNINGITLNDAEENIGQFSDYTAAFRVIGLSSNLFSLHIANSIHTLSPNPNSKPIT